MFDALKNLGNLGELMKKAGQMKEKMAQLQDDMSKREVTAEAAEGRVTATVSGRLELIKIKIDKSRINLDDTDLLEDLIVAAVVSAQAKAAAEMKEAMDQMASEMGIPPGMLPG